MTILWQSTVTQIGPDAGDMFEAGVIILFAEPVPPALAEVSVVHNSKPAASLALTAGDEFWLGENKLTVTEVGNLADTNLTELGHIVIYINPEGQQLLPGAVHASGHFGELAAGATIQVKRQGN